MSSKECFGCLCVLAVAAGCRDASKTPFTTTRQQTSRDPSASSTQASICNGRVDRIGVPVRGVVTAGDSSRFWVTETMSAEMPARQFVFTSPTCFPIESSDGGRLSGASLTPGRAVIVWIGELTIPTRPIQGVVRGVEIYDGKPLP